MERRRNVYVVDDSLSVRKAIEHMLAPQGIDVATAESGAQAITDLEQRTPDLIVCDLVLPDIEGFEVCRQIRRHAALQRVPVLFISGIVDDEIRRKSEAAGGDGVLKKPFSSTELLGRIEELLAASAPVRPELPPAAQLAIKRLERLRDFRFALLAGSTDGVLLRVGPEAPPEGSDLEQDILELAESAADVSARLSQGELGGLILESEQGLLLLHAAGPERSLVICLTGKPVLGQGRYLVRRTCRELASIQPLST